MIRELFLSIEIAGGSVAMGITFPHGQDYG